MQNYESQLGFTGIAVAFLGQNNPIGIVFAAILWGDPVARRDRAADRDRRAAGVRRSSCRASSIFSVVVVYQIAKRRLARRGAPASGCRGRAPRYRGARARRTRERPDGPRRHRRRDPDRVHVLHDPLPHGSRGSLQRALRHREHRSRGPHGGRHRHRRRRGRDSSAGPRGDGVGRRAAWCSGLLFGACCGALFASVHAVATIKFRVDHIVSGVVDQPRGDRARAVPVVHVLRARRRSPTRAGRTCHGSTSRCCPTSRGVSGRRSRTSRPMVPGGLFLVDPGHVRAVPDPLGPAAAFGGREPRGHPVARRARSRRSAGRAVLLSGAFAGLSGAFLSVEVVNNWREGQTLGPRVHRARRADPVELGSRSG